MSEELRHILCQQINTDSIDKTRVDFEVKYGQVWNTKELQQDYNVQSFAAPFCKVIRKSDNISGILTFSHNPRFYWGFKTI